MGQSSSSSRVLLAGLVVISLLLGLYAWKTAPDDAAGARGNDVTIGPIDATEVDGPSLVPVSADPVNASHNRRARPVVGSAVPPAFPIEAVKRGESGKVILEVVVDARGQATGIRVATSSGSPALDEAAREAVGRWRFEPALEDNEPVADTIEIPIDFEPAR